MDAKEYLMQIKIIRAKLDVIDANIRKLKQEIEKLTEVTVRSAWPDGQPRGTKTTDPTGTTASRLADQNLERCRELHKQLLEYEYEQLQEKSRLWSKSLEVYGLIGEIKDAVLYTIIVKRYIDGDTFEQIAVDINYTWRHTINLHGKALQEVQKLLDRNDEKTIIS